MIMPAWIICGDPNHVSTYIYCTTNQCIAGKNNWRKKKIVDDSGEICQDSNYKCDCPPYA